MANNGQERENERLKNSVKAGANAFGGPLAGKAVDIASKTKSGQAVLNKGNQMVNATNPIKNGPSSINPMDGSNSADQDNNIESNESGNGNSALKNDSSKENKSTLNNLNQEDSNNNKESDATFFEQKNKKFDVKKVILAVAPAFLIIILIILVIGTLYSVGDAFKSFIINGINNFVDIFTKDQEELEKDFYKALQETQYKTFKKENICVDGNLMIAALTVESEFYNNDPDAIYQQQDDPESGTDELDENGSALDYKRMKKQLALLAAMQIKHIVYGWNKTMPVGGKCQSSTPTLPEIQPINSDDIDAETFDKTNFLIFKENGLDSSTPELVAKHDITGFKALFLKKASEEKNYEYVFYQPTATRECTGGRDANGVCLGWSDVCRATTLPDDKAELSIGDDSDILNTMEDGVFYWNLRNSFIPNYYKDYLPAEEGEEKELKIKEIADSIYYLYKEMGPSRECTSITPDITYDNSNLCPQGVTVVDEDTNETVTVDLETYVAGVVAHEASLSEGMEALKAQAVAARTYALNRTNYCQNPILNSTKSQKFYQNPPEIAVEAAQSTVGEVLKYNGAIFSAMYDSYCIDDPDCPDSKNNGDGTFSVTYSKMPALEKHVITIDASYEPRFIPGKGHAHGMSQLLSYQMAKEGKNYQEILRYFYSDGVVLTKSTPTAEETPTNTDIITRTAEEELLANGYTLEEFNNYIAQSVDSAGFGTRNGVVAAAVAMINGFYDRTGKKLNYAWGGDRTGRYGIGGTWKQPPLSKQCYEQSDACYYYQGLDCAAFVSWALHNGGFAYEYNTSTGRNNSQYTEPHSWPYTEGKPGDLLSTKYDNGGGHIQLIVGVTDTGYVLAHAGSYATGIMIHSKKFDSACKNCTVIDMDKYYANYPKAQR